MSPPVDADSASQSRGLGDTVARVLERFGFRRRKGCGCARRQARLNRWFPYRRRHAERAGAIDAREPAPALLFRFPHGLGDAVQLTTVLLHLAELRPNWTVDVACKRGVDSLFAGLCRRTIVASHGHQFDHHRLATLIASSRYAVDRTLPWGEPEETYAESPSTKAEKCLRDVLGIRPIERLCRYRIARGDEANERAETYLRSLCRAAGMRFPVVLIHYQGNSARGAKNLDERTARELVRVVRRRGLLPVVLDFELPARSRLVREQIVACPRADDRLWSGLGTGDGATIAALIARSTMMIGIDSGPAHVAGATDTPTAVVWLRHHPVNYYGLADHVTHLVRMDRGRFLRGDRETGEAYFRRRYRSVEADEHYRRFLPAWLDETLRRA